MEGFASEAFKYVGAGGAVGIVCFFIGAKLCAGLMYKLIVLMGEIKGLLEERSRAEKDE